jgi:phosphoribosylpyrophosphate synthetase
MLMNAMKRASAHKVVIVFMGYARQDRRTNA